MRDWNTGRDSAVRQYNRGLSVDWIWDRELRYQGISAARAMVLIEAGEVGALDSTEHREVLAALLEAPAITLEDAVINDRRGSAER